MKQLLVRSLGKWRFEHEQVKTQALHMQAALFKWTNQNILCAFDLWLCLVRAEAQNSDTIRWSLMKMMQGPFCRSLNTWRQVAGEIGRARKLLHISISRYSNQKLTAFLLHWHNVTVSLQWSQDTSRQVLYRMLHREMSGALHTWQYVAQVQMYSKNQIRAALYRWTHTSLIRTLISWRAATNVWVRAQGMKMWAVKRWSNSQAASAFSQWLEIAQLYTLQRRQAMHAILLWCNYELGSGLATWRAGVDQRKDMVGSLSQAIARWRRQSLYSCWME
jgi:hypothetical protein